MQSWASSALRSKKYQITLDNSKAYNRAWMPTDLYQLVDWDSKVISSTSSCATVPSTSSSATTDQPSSKGDLRLSGIRTRGDLVPRQDEWSLQQPILMGIFIFGLMVARNTVWTLRAKVAPAVAKLIDRHPKRLHLRSQSPSSVHNNHDRIPDHPATEQCQDPWNTTKG